MNVSPQTPTSSRVLFLSAVVFAAAIARLLPHAPNVTPIAALALFGGAKFSNRTTAFLVVFSAMLLSDLVIGLDVTSPFVYGSLALIVLVGSGLGERARAAAIGGGSLAGSVIFFVVTNFGTWLMQDLYPKSVVGLMACFTAAIPFFQNSLAGDLVFSAVLFGGAALIERAIPQLRLGAQAIS